jgi:hypothetical protein
MRIETRTLRRAAVGLVLALAWPAVTTAQSITAAERDALVRQVVARGGQPGDLDGLLRVVDQAVAASLPSTPLVNKIREGLAKNVAVARIDPVVRRLAADLGTADRLVRDLVPGSGGASRQAAVGQLGEALSSDVTPEEVRSLFEALAGTSAASAGRLASAARALAFIKDANLPAADGSGVVAEAARRGFRDDEIVDLGREVKRRELDYQSGRATLQALRSAIARGERPEQLFPAIRPDTVERPARPDVTPERPVRPERVEPTRPTPVERPSLPERPQRP